MSTASQVNGFGWRRVRPRRRSSNSQCTHGAIGASALPLLELTPATQRRLAEAVRIAAEARAQIQHRRDFDAVRAQLARQFVTFAIGSEHARRAGPVRWHIGACSRCAAEPSSTPGRSLLRNTAGCSMTPVANTTAPARSLGHALRLDQRHPVIGVIARRIGCQSSTSMFPAAATRLDERSNFAGRGAVQARNRPARAFSSTSNTSAPASAADSAVARPLRPAPMTSTSQKA